jgi:hypothetical protein
VRCARNPDGDGGALDLQGYRLEDADTQALLAALRSEHCKITKLITKVAVLAIINLLYYW